MRASVMEVSEGIAGTEKGVEGGVEGSLMDYAACSLTMRNS
jgi:hypothetical protein